VKQSARAWIIDGLAILVGSALMAAALVIFTIPNDIAPGGVSGLATALAHLTPLNVGLLALMLNVPIVALAWWRLGFMSIVKSIASAILVSVLIDLFTLWLPAYAGNRLLAAVFGGVIIGAGVGIIFVRGASTGGTDLIGMMLRRAFPTASLGSMVMVADVAVVLFAVCVFRDIEVALYSMITIFVATKTIDAIMQGIDTAKVIFVITERGEDVCAVLADKLGRGLTLLDAEGGYTRRKKKMLMLVAHRSEFSRTLSAIKAADPEAFLFISSASEVHGKGFKQ